MRALLASGSRRLAAAARQPRERASLAARPGLRPAPCLGAARCAATAAPAKISALADAARRLREAVVGPEVLAEIAAKADAPVDIAAAVARLGEELAAGEQELEVTLLGEVLADGPGRRSLSVKTPVGPGGGPPARTVSMRLPSADDIKRLIETRREQNPRAEKPEEMADVLEKFLEEKLLGRRTDHVAMISAWGAKAVADADGEFAEIAALIAMSLKAYRAALSSMNTDFQFEVYRDGDGRECLVMPPSNFALLGLKDAALMLLQGFRVLAVVQPHFLPQYLEFQRDLYDCGLPNGLFEVVPGITPEADPAVLHEALKHVDRLQFTGSSAMYKGLVTKAYELGNLRMEHGGEVSGLNKVRLDGVSATHPAAAAGSAWAAMANNGELCTSASIVEFDPATGDTKDTVKLALEAHSFRLGSDPADASLNVLLKDGKSKALEVKTEMPPEGFREWWEKAVLAVPRGDSPQLRTNQSLGHCIFAPSIKRAVSEGVKEDASCIYMVGVPEDQSAVSARAGTTGCKLPESVFGGMKSYTFAVAGDHDGVGSVQTLFNTVRRRGANWRDQEEATSEYELTETAEDLLEFLSPKDQQAFCKQIYGVLDVFSAFEPAASAPYNGQGLVGGEGSSQLVSLPALRPSRKHLLIPKGVGLPEDMVKLALLAEMSPLRELPVSLHLLSVKAAGKLQLKDPLKSFLRVVEKRLGWKLHFHEDYDQLAEAVRGDEYPPYFFAVKDRHLHPNVLMAVAEQGGYMYEGIPSDALSLFRWLTATQAWTVACTEAQVAEAQAELGEAWRAVGLRAEPHPAPEIRQPKPRDADVGGGFGGMGGGMGDDKDWAELDSDDESSSDEEEKKEAKEAPKAEEAAKEPAPK